MSAFPMYGKELGWHRGKTTAPSTRGGFFLTKENGK